MLNLKRVFKNYEEAGSLSAMVNLFGFVGPQVFLTKSGEAGIVLELQGVDYECLDTPTLDGLTKRLESALRLFEENYRVYQLLFKRNRQAIPHSFCGKPIVDAAIRERIAYLAGKAEDLFSLTSQTQIGLDDGESAFFTHPGKNTRRNNVDSGKSQRLQLLG